MIVQRSNGTTAARAADGTLAERPADNRKFE
jgi:hypothetical protein